MINTMTNLRESLWYKYSDKDYTMQQVAKDVIDLLHADKTNYFDITGFAMDFFLSNFDTKEEKNNFYEELKKEGFFSQLNVFLYSDNFSICSWTIYVIGKFSNNENAGYLEMAYETTFSSTNPMLSYRCLLELHWLSSGKTENYLLSLELERSKSAKLILLYFWEPHSDNLKFKELIADKDLLKFIVPSGKLDCTEDEISNRLFAFESFISKIYNSTEKSSISITEFESAANKFFKEFEDN
jgi:hypothetical protein